MKLLFLLFMICSSSNSFSQNYDASLINDSLKENANAVKRFEEEKLIIKSVSRAVLKHKYAVTILNEKGADKAFYESVYNGFEKTQSISGRLYDARGKEIKSVKKKDIGDYSANDDTNLMTDTRLKRHNFYFTQYPYTVEYEDEKELTGLFFLPAWQPIEDEKYSVQQSSFTVEAPADFSIRFKQTAYTEPPLETNIMGKKTYYWQVKNLPAVSKEPYQPDWNEINPAVYSAPSRFELQDYKGDMSTWLKLGLFIKELNSNRQQLPDAVKKDIHRLTDNISNTNEKIRILYNYLQANTRYISVQLGIGSWQPFDATYVASKKYGDCKALSNYMIGLLKEVNIPGKYVLVTAGSNRKGLWEDFPSPYFNHVIVCVPQLKDSLWLECTSQSSSAGYMGSFTENRNALLIDEDGGHLVHTPVYNASDNLQIRKVKAVITEQGTLTADVSTKFTGLQQELVQSLMYGATPAQKKNYLNNTLSLPTYTVEKFEYTETKGVIPEMNEHLQILSPDYATVSGKRIFVTPNFFNRSDIKLPVDDERKYDIIFSSSFTDRDTIQIEIPEDYVLESMPRTIQLKNKYGNYSISFSVKDHIIQMFRKNEKNAGRFSKTEYPAIAEFVNEIFTADRGRIVFLKKDKL